VQTGTLTGEWQVKIVIFCACVLLLLGGLAAVAVRRRSTVESTPPTSFTFKVKANKTFPDGSLKTRLIRNFRQTGQERKAPMDNVRKQMTAEFFNPAGSVPFRSAGSGPA
jgi:hypothetical protein